VPGLAAKPVIDIQVSVTDLGDEESYVPAVESAGLVLRAREDTRAFFRPPAEAPRDVHVHVCQAGGWWEREHLLFRDYLRARPGTRAQYGELKRELAAVWPDDRAGYTEAKSGSFSTRSTTPSSGRRRPENVGWSCHGGCMSWLDGGPGVAG
jgi:GrpB-like predicted nucleotidyltransferase (UPF0157 family)